MQDVLASSCKQNKCANQRLIGLAELGYDQGVTKLSLYVFFSTTHFE